MARQKATAMVGKGTRTGGKSAQSIKPAKRRSAVILHKRLPQQLVKGQLQLLQRKEKASKMTRMNLGRKRSGKRKRKRGKRGKRLKKKERVLAGKSKSMIISQ